MKINAVLIGALLLIALLTYRNFFYENIFAKYKISIKNRSDRAIRHIILKLNEVTTITTISVIESDKERKYSLDTRNTEEENSMVLEYKDYHGVIHQELIAGYFEDKYSGSTDVIINSIDEHGVLNLEIKENLSN